MSDASFETRKQDHIRLALDPKIEASGGSGVDGIELVHEALPDLNFNDIQISTNILDRKISVPFFVSSMTAGHGQSEDLNSVIASACEKRGWPMGVGSQRRELSDSSVSEEWKRVRKHAPNVLFLGNLGLSQVITTPVSEIQKLVDSLQAFAMIVHTNPLQEALQPEGTPQFKGGLKALSVLARDLSVPVILKETGCGFSKDTLKRLQEVGLGAVDVSGFGGTHWGRIEGQRSEAGSIKNQAAETFSNWGISTIDSLLAANEVRHAFEKKIRSDEEEIQRGVTSCASSALTPETGFVEVTAQQNISASKNLFEIWASGGVRTGLDAAKLLAIGARTIGFAKPILQNALNGTLEAFMERVEYELKVAMFCTGSSSIPEFQSKKPWRIK